MKKLLYFLIGFALVAFPMRFVCAGTVCSYVPEDFHAEVLDKLLDMYPSYSNPSYWNFYGCGEGELPPIPEPDGAGYKTDSFNIQGISVTARTRKEWSPREVGWAYSISTCFTTPDTDGDGIPDECDFYPDDATPYQYKKIGYNTDGTTETFAIYYTDQGDYFSTGDPGTNQTLDYYDPGANWQSPDSECSDFSSYAAGTDGTSTEPEQPLYPGGVPDGSPADGDPILEDGTASTGSETDNEALIKIIDNTQKTTDNITGLAAYLKEINQGIQNIDTNIAFQESPPTASEIGSAVGDALDVPVTGDDTAAVTAAGQVDDSAILDLDSDFENSDAYTDSNIDTDLKPWTQQQFNDFLDYYIDNNPLAAIFDVSNFVSVTGSSPCFSSSYNGNNIDFCFDDYATQLQYFGSFIVALAGLSGVMLILRK